MKSEPGCGCMSPKTGRPNRILALRCLFGKVRESLPGLRSQRPAKSQERQFLARGRPVSSKGPKERRLWVLGTDGGLLNDAEKALEDSGWKRSMASSRDQEGRRKWEEVGGGKRAVLTPLCIRCGRHSAYTNGLFLANQKKKV